jgi:hypothetical protein
MSLSGGYAVTSWMSVIGSLDWFKSIGNAEVSDELVARSFSTGLKKSTARNEIIKDTIGLEPDDLSGTIGLQFNITPQVQTVLSYSRDLTGDGYFSTKNNAFGETVALNLVYIH